MASLPFLPHFLQPVPGDLKTKLSCMLSPCSTFFLGHIHLCPSPPRRPWTVGERSQGSPAEGKSLAWDLGNHETRVFATACHSLARWLRAGCFSQRPEVPPTPARGQDEQRRENVLRGPVLLELRFFAHVAPETRGAVRHQQLCGS